MKFVTKEFSGANTKQPKLCIYDKHFFDQFKFSAPRTALVNFIKCGI